MQSVHLFKTLELPIAGERFKRDPMFAIKKFVVIRLTASFARYWCVSKAISWTGFRTFTNVADTVTTGRWF